MHAVAETHDTEPMRPHDLCATDITRQREPSHAKGCGPPVRPQNRGDVHDTDPALSWPTRNVNLHRKPVHIPTIAPQPRRCLNEVGNTNPVAAQKRTDAHDTSLNSLRPPGSRVG
jgi:hypothetical protein